VRKKEKELSLDDILNEHSKKTVWEKPSSPVSAHETSEVGPEKPSTAQLPPLKDIDRSAVLAILHAIATLDPGTIFNEYGAILPLDQMPLETRVCIRSIKVKEVFDRDGVKEGEIKEIQFWDKTSATENLGKFKKMFNDQGPQQVNNFLIVESLKRGFERLSGVTPINDASTVDVKSQRVFENSTTSNEESKD
jgi:hypothetical protein